MRRWLICAWLVILPAAVASDRQRETDYAAAIEKTPSPGQTVWLKAGSESFVGLYIDAEKTDQRKAVIILHDIGDYPDQQPLIRGLRTTLPQHQWATLSLQMPLREAGAGESEYYPLFDEAKARVEAAVDYLRGGGADTIALVGYGLGGAMAAYAVNAKPEGVAALVTISLPLIDSLQPAISIADALKNIALPFLDVYAEFDLPVVVDSARQRRMLAKDNPVFRQTRIEGENHAYPDDPAMLIKRIYSWLASEQL